MDERHKGKSLLAIPADYTVVDLETTGLSARYNHIIEISCLKYREGKELSRYQTLIKPPEPIPYIIECITGIKNEMVTDSPTFNDVAREVWEYLEGEIIVGHNINFDINFLYDNFKITLDKGFSNDFVDTLRMSRRLLPDIKFTGIGGHGLDNLCHYFGIVLPEISRHRATGDCLLTNEVFKRLKDFVIEHNIDLSALVKSSSRKLMLQNIQSDSNNFDASHIFFDKNCVFTGKLEKFLRADAAQIVANIGGRCEKGVTKKTNFLIVGDMDYREGLKGYETIKMQKAKSLIEQGQDLQIIPESAFYDLVTDYLECVFI